MNGNNNCVGILLVMALFVIFFYYCYNNSKSNYSNAGCEDLKTYSNYKPCVYMDDYGLNRYTPNVWPNCYLNEHTS